MWYGGSGELRLLTKFCQYAVRFYELELWRWRWCHYWELVMEILICDGEVVGLICSDIHV